MYSNKTASAGPGDKSVVASLARYRAVVIRCAPDCEFHLKTTILRGTRSVHPYYSCVHDNVPSRNTMNRQPTCIYEYVFGRRKHYDNDSNYYDGTNDNNNLPLVLKTYYSPDEYRPINNS